MNEQQKAKSVYSFSGALIARFFVFLILGLIALILFGVGAWMAITAERDSAIQRVNELTMTVEKNQVSTECRAKANGDVQVARAEVSNALDLILADVLRGEKVSAAHATAYSEATDRQDDAVAAYVLAIKNC